MKMKDPIGELVNANDVISGTKGKSMVLIRRSILYVNLTISSSEIWQKWCKDGQF